MPINGTFIRIVLEVNPAILTDNQTIISQGRAIIISTLFPHECKLSVMHFKIQRAFDNKDTVPSKTEVEIHCGFRRLTLKPVFGLETSSSGHSSDKLKYMRFLRHDVAIIASAYSPIIFSPCKVLMFNKDEQGSLKILATGIVMPPNPLSVILKRIILTGYPLKVHKKRSVIRYMFFNPKDVKYFKPVELYSKFGLRVS